MCFSSSSPQLTFPSGMPAEERTHSYCQARQLLFSGNNMLRGIPEKFKLSTGPALPFPLSFNWHMARHFARQSALRQYWQSCPECLQINPARPIIMLGSVRAVMYKFTPQWSRHALVCCVNIAACTSDTLTRNTASRVTVGDRLQG